MLPQCGVCTTEKRAKASKETRLPLQTKMKPSKTGTLCEKPAKECNQDNPLLKNNTSDCSCSKCNFVECFAMRNKEYTLCHQGSIPLPFPESNKITTNTGQSKSSLHKCKLPETESVLRERVKKETTYEYNNPNNVATVKKYSRYSYNCLPEFSDQGSIDVDDKIKMSTEKLAHSHSSTTNSKQNIDSNAATLSAQIMNVPYKDFKESISYNKTVISTPKPTKLSHYDIIRRIKEAYKACSCKVCECLIGKTTNRNELCKCKPCECNECTALNKIKQMPIGCPCIRCDRKQDCKGIANRGPPAYCDCEPCDCLKCTDSFNKPCSCQPCECIECRSYSVNKPSRNNTLVVASMREDVPRAYCQCSPCDCAECIQSFSMATSLRREMGTGINRPVNCSCETCVNQSCEAHDSNSCTCDVQKRLMRKPVEKDTRDYDIHRASIIKNVTERKSKNKNNTIAMFAAVGSSFPFEIKNNSCSCDDCECILCSCKEKATTLIQEKPSKCNNLRACKCSPCECVICDSSNKDIDILDRKHICECNTCDCIKCDGLSKPSTSNYDRHTKSINFKNMISSNACKCSPCECTECQKIMYKCTGDSCFCNNCKCQKCRDQTKFINETVYRNSNDDYLHLPCTHSNDMNGEYFLNKNDGKTCLTQNSQQSDIQCTIQIKSRPALAICNEYTSFEGLKDNPIRKSTQVLIANNSEIVEQKRHQTTSACEPYDPSKEKKIVQSYHRAPEYESSRSCMSENSSIGLSYRISNIPESGNLSSVSEQKHTSKSVFDIETPFDTHDRVILKPLVETCCNGFTNLESLNAATKTYQNMNYPNSDVNQHGKGADPIIISPNITNNDFSGVDDRSCLLTPISETFSKLSKSNNFSVQNHKITNVKDLSLNLVSSLKNANERLSILMKPKFPCYHPKLEHLKADISLPTKANIRKETISTWNYEFNSALQNSYPKYPENLSDIEIDYDKIRSTLQQAKAFSVELSKLLSDYKKANRKLVSKSLKDTPTNIYSNSLLDENHSSETNNIEINKMIHSNVKYENLLKCLDQEPYYSYDPVKKYGSHNLNVTKTKPEISDTDVDQISKIHYSTKNIPDNESAKVTHDVDDSLNIITRKDIQRQAPLEHSHGKISINEPSTSKVKQYEEPRDEHRELLTNACNQTNEDKHKYRSDKTQKNIKGGKRLRVPKSVILYKRLKLKEALINLASNASNNGIRQDNLVPQCIQCNNVESVISDDKPTQHEPYFLEDKHETTSTATDALGRHEAIGFVEPVQYSNGVESLAWSLLKKNCLMNSPHSQNKRSSLVPPLLLEVKDTLRAISRQYDEPGRSEVSNEVTVNGHGNRALLQLQTEVNKLWQLSMPQSSHKPESKSEVPIGNSKLKLDVKDFRIASSQTLTDSVEKAVNCQDSAFSVVTLKSHLRELLDCMSSVKNSAVKKSLIVNDVESSGGSNVQSESIITKNSCNTLKVKFLGLRRVSDHTVLVKWKAPQDLTSVQGYELLVDGRAVQKILSPSRCMAVVTCLPHIDKVLITIRTLVSTATQRTHYPSATIVYRTRVK